MFLQQCDTEIFCKIKVSVKYLFKEAQKFSVKIQIFVNLCSYLSLFFVIFTNSYVLKICVL
jgi:hypothetical protein